MASSVISSSESSVTIHPVEQPLKYGSVPAENQDDDGWEKQQDTWRPRAYQTLEHFITIIGLYLATYIGVLLRIYLSYFSLWDGVQHFPSMWAQVVGTAFIGALIAYKDKLQVKHKILYTSLSTGLCGSLTTFSSWNAEASKVLLQLNETTLQPLYSAQHASRAVGFFTVLLLGVGMPVAALLLGKNSAELLSFSNYGSMKHCSAIFCCLNKTWLLLLFSIVGYTFVTLNIILICLFTNSYQIMFSLIFGGLGTYIRWRLSFLDKHSSKFKFIKDFPFGTFLANSIGSMILAGTLVSIAYTSIEIPDNVIVSALLFGIAIGFCGSLTTVSTFVSQLCALPFRSAMIYSVVSLTVAQLVFTAVLGTYSWTQY